MTNLIENPIFKDETAAREWLEARVWPNGATCPHCGNIDQDKITKLEGKAHRPGLYQCAACREQFTVTSQASERRALLLAQQKTIKVYAEKDFVLIENRMWRAYARLYAFSKPMLDRSFGKPQEPFPPRSQLPPASLRPPDPSGY